MEGLNLELRELFVEVCLLPDTLNPGAVQEVQQEQQADRDTCDKRYGSPERWEDTNGNDL